MLLTIEETPDKYFRNTHCIELKST